MFTGGKSKGISEAPPAPALSQDWKGKHKKKKAKAKPAEAKGDKYTSKSKPKAPPPPAPKTSGLYLDKPGDLNLGPMDDPLGGIKDEPGKETKAAGKKPKGKKAKAKGEPGKETKAAGKAKSKAKIRPGKAKILSDADAAKLYKELGLDEDK